MIKNLLRWDPLGTDAVLIANGPSVHDSYVDVVKDYPHFVVGKAGVWWPSQGYLWACMHHDKLAIMYDKRITSGLPAMTLISTRPIEDRPSFVYRPQVWRGGSSSLYAAELACSLGYKRLHVFGLDLTLDDRSGINSDYRVYRNYWALVNGIELIPYGESLSWMR